MIDDCELMNDECSKSMETMSRAKIERTTFEIAGSGGALVEYECDAEGRLIGLRAGGREYLRYAGGEQIFDDGFVIVSEARLGCGLLRSVRCGAQLWTEEYFWDDVGRPTYVDGVTIRRDEQGRITACTSAAGNWFYGYTGANLSVIDSPGGVRQLTHDARQRPVRARTGAAVTLFEYDNADFRRDVPYLPPNYHRDEMGRLWTIRDERGRIITTYMWHGFACLGRIDGAAGEPLSAVFSLDPSATPVRIIERDRVSRVPRDAWGENLVQHPGVPGLYGGVNYKGMFYYRARSLDPRTGAFTSPEPWQGDKTDPRRKTGYGGNLPVDNGSAGLYAVCQHDPIGYADPTGEILTPLLILSDLTWAISNNIVGWLGFDWIINFWGSIFTGKIGKFFNFVGLSDPRSGSFGVARDGALYSGRAFCFQHIIMEGKDELESLDDARVFNPKGRFTPTLYGTLLRGVPKDGTAFLLNGSAPNTAQLMPNAWSRNGGTAEPVVPGSLTPHFPAGGLHFQNIITGTYDKQECILTELEASGIGAGNVQNRIQADLTGTSLGLNAGGLLFFTQGTTTTHFIGTLAAAAELGNGNTRVYLTGDIPGLSGANIRVRNLTAAVTTENLTHPAALANNYLSVAGSAGAYTRGDPLGINQGGNRIGARLISNLEARLQIDGALTGLNTPLVIRVTTPGGVNNATLTGTNTILDFAAAAPKPGVGEAILVRGGGASLAVVITAASGNQRTLDRALTPAFGASGATVTWQPLPPGGQLGRREGTIEAGNDLTYAADSVRSAPTTGFIRIEDRDGKLAARAVTALTYDAIVLGSDLPGTVGNPYSIERFGFGAVDRRDVTITRTQGLVLNPPPGNDIRALQIYQFGTPALALPAAPVVVLNGAVAANVLRGATVAGTSPNPGQVIALRVGGALTPAFVRRVRLTVTLDRNLPAATNPIEAVRLDTGGFTYRALRQTVTGQPNVVTLRPVAVTAGADANVEMPRLRVDELVRANWTGGPANGLLFRVREVDGTTLRLEGTPDLPAPTPATPDPTPNLTITRLSPVAPFTLRGSSRTGRAGSFVTGTTNRVTFDVWDQGDFRTATPYAFVVDGASVPAFVNSLDETAIEFTPLGTFSDAPGVDTVLPNAPTVAVSVGEFSRDGAQVVINGSALAVSPNLVLAVYFRETTVKATGEVSGGSVLVPNDPENWEFTRRESVTAHELTHTIQYCKFGPLWFNPFPLFALEGIIEATTNVELPEFSAYVAGTVRREGSTRLLTITGSGVTFAVGDHVQLSWSSPQTVDGSPVEVSGAGVARSTVLGANQAGAFRLTMTEAELPPQVTSVQVRKENGDSGWKRFLDVMHFTTPGGLMNFIGGGYFGSLFWLIGKGFYGLGRAIFGAGDQHNVTVEDGGNLLRFANEAGRNALRGANRVTVQSGGATVVRSVTGDVGETMRLSARVSFTSDVKVAPFNTHTPGDYFDWHNYFPASVPDAAKPATIRVETVGTDSLTLARFDRVALKAGDQSRDTNVVNVNPDGTVDLEQAPAFSAEPTFRIAKIGEGDPMGNIDSVYLTNVLGMDWMKWIFDPWGQIQFRALPEAGSFWDVTARIARYAFGTQSWSLLPGFFFSVLFIDRIVTKEHLSGIEQEASVNSGDTYTPLGVQRGSIEYVGDIARYWFVPLGGLRNSDNLVTALNQYDAPGVRFDNVPRWMPFVHTAAAGAGEPNQGARVNPATANPARALPDIFANKQLNNPNAVFLTDIPSFDANNRGWIPTSPTLERTNGIYIAFSRPSFAPGDSPRGRHRVTVRDGETGAFEGRDAQEKDKAKLFYNLEVADVTVRATGRDLAEGDELTLILGQRVTVTVTPNGARRYRANLLRPANGATLRRDGELSLIAQATTGREPVEISRFYAFNSGTGKFESGGLVQHGIHLPHDVDIPVRNFTVNVVNEIPVRTAADNLASIEVAPVVLGRGQARFIYVPGPIRQALRQESAIFADGTPAPVTINPTNVTPLADAVRAFVGSDGAVFRVEFPAATPLAQPVDLVFIVRTGSAAPGFEVRTRLRVQP
jgi:large repetitive protein